ncbi:bola-like protein [Polychaeton citri CBS 116435]|uniref:Bola-like protein n=1 Tax=Polychaeton citri CBS 116435 TaxID=1314669 RepID=A0A9P4Q0D5_9PEZI|nr:bola-like protein [Polychaeton citri CBS 116435]
MAATGSTTPMEDKIRKKINTSLTPTQLEIHNDSHLHAHHAAMRGSVSRETHFRVYVTSDAFKSKMQPARHRMVYDLLKDEMAAEGGIHALQLRTRTLEEEERAKAKETTG